MSKKYKAILFDLDDTLIDNDESIKYAIFCIYNKLGIDCNEENFLKWKQFDTDYWHLWEDGKIIVPDWANSLDKRIDFLRSNRFIQFFHYLNLSYEEALNINRRYISLLADNVVRIDGAYELITTLFGNYELIISTNGPRESAYAKVRNANLYPYFSKIISSGECGFSKPMPGFFDYAISKMYTKDKEKMLIVGDSLRTDILGGINNKIDCCWFNPHHRHNRLNIEPTYEIDNLKSLIKKL